MDELQLEGEPLVRGCALLALSPLPPHDLPRRLASRVVSVWSSLWTAVWRPILGGQAGCANGETQMGREKAPYDALGARGQVTEL
jgi:hypothetical protein